MAGIHCFFARHKCVRSFVKIHPVKTTKIALAVALFGVALASVFALKQRGAMGTDVYLHDSYFMVSYLYHPLAVVFGLVYFGSLHFCWAKMIGRMYSKAWGKALTLILLAGVALTFVPQFLLGMWSMQRRYHAYSPELEMLNIMSSVGTIILALGFLLPVFLLLWIKATRRLNLE